jgi:hypothetical protein
MLSDAKHLGFSRSYEGEILRLRLRMTSSLQKKTELK